MYTRVIDRDSQLNLLRVYGTQRSDLYIFLRGLGSGDWGLLGLVVDLLRYLSNRGARIGDCLIISTSTYIGLLSYIAGPICRYDLGRTISVLVL